MKEIIRIIKYAHKYTKYLILSVFSMLLLTAAQLYAPLVVRRLINMIQNADPELGKKALILASILAVMYLVQSVCQYIKQYYTHYAAWNFVSDMRIRIYNHLQGLSLKFYHDKQTGQLMSRTSNDTAALETLIAHALPDLIVNILLLSGVAVILFSINLSLAVISLVTVPFLSVMAVKFAKKVLPTFRKTQQCLAEFNAVLHDNISGIKEIQVFNKQPFESGRVTEKSVAFTDINLFGLRLSASYHASIQFLNNMGNVIVIGFGGYLASLGKIPLADIVAFIMYLGMFYHPISVLGRINEDMQTALAGAQRIFELLDEKSDVREMPDAVKLYEAKGALEFEDVSFHYIEGIDVLKNIDLSIRPGELVALVGPTGVGKTTLASLVTRFYDPVSGRVLLDGHDLKELSLESLRDNISIVLQDVFLFNGTVAENIGYGKHGATTEDIVEAAKTAHAHEFISSLEKGYDTIIGERGIKLSGGQKQRLSIARAILRNSPLLILDEATASVDVETEGLIHQAIDNVIRNRTTIMIAHRLSTVKKADKIVVLNEGRIEEAGTHEELINTDGLYSRLYGIMSKQ